jgi:SnoaL-like polyketide cyclase
VADLVQRLMDLWLAPPNNDEDAAAAFRALYTDPVQINGVAMSAGDLVARARALHASYDGLRHELVDRVDAPGKTVIAFRMHGTHVGVLSTPLGDVAPTGRPVEILTVDVLTLQPDGKVSEIWVLSDQLGLLLGLDALALSTPAPPASTLD